MDFIWYADVFFLTELLRNYFLLCLTAAFEKRNPFRLRLILAAAAGSCGSILFLLIPALRRPVCIPAAAAALGSLMVFLAFPINGKRAAVRLLGFLFASAAVMSGGLSFFRQFFYLTELESLLCMGAVMAGLAAFFWAGAQSRRLGTLRYPVRLYYRGKEKEFMALADSGNRLREPVTGKPVSVISYEDCRGFCDTLSAVFCIPYRSVGKEQGMLTGIVFERMEIFRDSGVLTVEKPVVAVAREPLSADGSFTMLLPEELVI